MAGMVPFFFTGGLAKIKINGVVLAFCTDFSYSVEVPHQAARVLGMYEASSLEPLSYRVTGSFAVVRYMNAVKDNLELAKYVTPNATNSAGNGIGAWTPNNAGGVLGAALRIGAVGNDGRAQESFDPSKLGNATFFDIEIYQKMPPGTPVDIRGVAHLRNCRINRADMNISKKSAALQKFTFEAIFLDEDSFLANFSGSAAG